jgi:hypothetical protein
MLDELLHFTIFIIVFLCVHLIIYFSIDHNEPKKPKLHIKIPKLPIPETPINLTKKVLNFSNFSTPMVHNLDLPNIKPLRFKNSNFKNISEDELMKKILETLLENINEDDKITFSYFYENLKDVFGSKEQIAFYWRRLLNGAELNFVVSFSILISRQVLMNF